MTKNSFTRLALAESRSRSRCRPPRPSASASQSVPGLERRTECLSTEHSLILCCPCSSSLSHTHPAPYAGYLNLVHIVRGLGTVTDHCLPPPATSPHWQDPSNKHFDDDDKTTCSDSIHSIAWPCRDDSRYEARQTGPTASRYGHDGVLLSCSNPEYANLIPAPASSL